MYQGSLVRVTRRRLAVAQRVPQRRTDSLVLGRNSCQIISLNQLHQTNLCCYALHVAGSRGPQSAKRAVGRRRTRTTRKNKKDILSYCHLNRHALPRHTPRCSVSGMRTHTAYGRVRPPHPRRFAVLVHAGGCWFPGCFWRWPVAVYARSRVTAAHSVPVCTVETAQRRAHWARPCASGLVRVFWHMRVAVCAGWGALRGTGVDAHAVCAVCACVLACLRAVPTPTPRAPTAATSLGHKTIHGTNMLIVGTCDGAEHASLLKLPPRIRRLTLRWDAMDM